MHSRIRTYGAALVACLAFAFAFPAGLAARPKPGVTPSTGFRLFARSLGASTVNRVFCGLGSSGRVCADSTGSSTIPGGYWPKGSPNQYVFNSGMQFAGVIQNSTNGVWNGDTTGAFFFDANGNLSHGEEIQPIYNFQSAADAATWPAAANVPNDARNGGVFFPLLQGLKSASQGDIWFMTWDGNPALNSGRSHPLGIMVETRMMGWNYPIGNQDILYLVYTFYNISSTCAADYNGVRPDMQAILLTAAARFQANNNAAFGINLPACGYTINNFYANMAADPDVSTDAGDNYASVNLPFQLGFIWERSFEPSGGTYVLPPDIGGPPAPFMGGMGFFGIKYLASPDSGTFPNVAPVGLTLFNSTQNGVDPNNAVQLYRFISGGLSPALGDPPCDTGDPKVTHICNIFGTFHDDRFAQSSGPFTLAPGASGSVVVAYIFASPVRSGPCQVPAKPGVGTCGNLLPGDPTKLFSVANLTAKNVNTVDSITGFLSYTAGAETSPVEANFNVVKGSLLDKANVAQAVFDAKFLLPFAPAGPEFFLVPGDNQVAVFWRKSATETSGDLFYSIAHQAKVIDPTTHTLVNNSLYDPNYRQLDVEGYRIYRGRSESQLSVIAQFDYAGTTFQDYDGVVNPVPTCAPDIAVTTSCAGQYSAFGPGITRTLHVDYPIVGDLVQVGLGSRLLLANGTAFSPSADTAVTGAASGKFPKLSDTGVPFVFVDSKALNNLRYFYAVTAFDVNSLQSGPSSLESAPNVKSVIPVHPASNYSSAGVLTPHVVGRGVAMDTIIKTAPTLDPTNGTFSGPQQPANGGVLGFVGQFLTQVVNGQGDLAATLDSLTMGEVDLSTCCGAGGPAVGQTFYVSVTAGGGPATHLQIPIQQLIDNTNSAQATFNSLHVNNSLAIRYGGNSNFTLPGAMTINMPATGPNGNWGLGFALGEPGFTAGDLPGGATAYRFNGDRWFSGANESAADPIAACGSGITGACNPVAGNATTTFANAGTLAGVTVVYQPRAYTMINREWRNISSITSTVRRAADFRVYWGAAGKVDSVIDVTHNVVVPFQADSITYGWGVLNTAATGAGGFDGRAGVLTPLDWTCVKDIRGSAGGENFWPCGLAAGTDWKLSQTAQLGAIAFGAGDNSINSALPQNAQNPANLEAQPGFSMYISGSISFFEMPALPAAGTVWTLRTYSGIVAGGHGPGGSPADGPYHFTGGIRPFTAVGAALTVHFNATNAVRASTTADLDLIHTVPDPYYVTNAYEVSPSAKFIKFVNLPQKCIIRVYSTSGVLVRVIEHLSTTFGGEEDWDVRNRNNQVVASGVYFYSIESNFGPRTVKRLTIVNFAQ